MDCQHVKEVGPRGARRQVVTKALPLGQPVRPPSTSAIAMTEALQKLTVHGRQHTVLSVG